MTDYGVRGGAPVLVKPVDGGEWEHSTLPKVTYFPTGACVLDPTSPGRRNKDSYTFLDAERGLYIDVPTRFVFRVPGMKTELRQLVRSAISERLSLTRDEADQRVWKVSAAMLKGFGDFAGFDSRVGGYNKLGVFAPIVARKEFEVSTIKQGRAPVDATPKDALIALKTERPYTNEAGVTLVPDPGLIDALVVTASKAAASHYRGEKIDIVTTVESSSRLAAEFGKAVAAALGVKFAPVGLLKQKDPSLLQLDFGETDWKDKMDPTQLKRYEDALNRMRRKMASGLSASLRSHFRPQDRKFVKGMLALNPDMLDHVSATAEPPSVLIVDDVITSGSTTSMAKQELLDYGFQIAGACAIFKMEDTR